jgi:hypothetical protein
VSVFQGSQVLLVFLQSRDLGYHSNALQHFHNGFLYFCEVDSGKPARIGGLDMNTTVLTDTTEVGVQLSTGVLNSLENCLLYTGGLVVDPDAGEAKSSPIIKYDLTTQQIQHLTFDPNLQSEPQQSDALDEPPIEVLTPNSLKHPGSCTDGFRFLYLIGGTYLPLAEQNLIQDESNTENASAKPSKGKGGSGLASYYDGVMLVDVINNSYTELQIPLPSHVEAPYCTMLSENEILVAGGRDLNKRKTSLSKKCFVIQVKQGRATSVADLPHKFRISSASMYMKRPNVTLYQAPLFAIFNIQVKKWCLIKLPLSSLDTPISQPKALRKIEAIKGGLYLKLNLPSSAEVDSASSSRLVSELDLGEEFTMPKSSLTEYLSCFANDFRISTQDEMHREIVDDAPDTIRAGPLRTMLGKVVPLEHKFYIKDIKKHLKSIQKLTGCMEFSRHHVKKLLKDKDLKLRWLNAVQGVDIVVKAYQSMQAQE